MRTGQIMYSSSCIGFVYSYKESYGGSCPPVQCTGNQFSYCYSRVMTLLSFSCTFRQFLIVTMHLDTNGKPPNVEMKPNQNQNKLDRMVIDFVKH